MPVSPLEPGALARPSPPQRPLLVAAVALAAVALAIVTAASPLAGLAAAGIVALGGAIWNVRVGAVLLAVSAAVGCAAVAVAATAWPTTTGLAAVVLGCVVLALHAPATALAAGVLLLGLEGSVKVLLGLEPTPLGGPRPVGAAAIDLALFASVAASLAAGGTATARSLWRRATRVERAAVGLVGLWLAVSVAQVFQSGDPRQGVEGLRLLHAYVAVGAAAAVVIAAVPRLTPRRVTAGVLTVGLVVSAYAALRVAIGPSDAEALFAVSGVKTTASYGDELRAFGSFSSAIGLVSFLTPIAVFAFVVTLFGLRLRVPALAVGVLSLIAILGSYGRAPLLGILAGALFAVAAVFAASSIPWRTKLVTVLAALAALGLTWGGLQVAASQSPELRERARGVLDPFGDESAKLRWETWEKSMDRIERNPLGEGVGTVGGASADAPGATALTTDNSFLKVAVDQGIPVAVLLVIALLAIVLLLARRLTRAGPERRAAGLAALAGFVAFLAISVLGEYVEQPGKAVAWALLGIALAMALAGDEPRGEQEVDNGA